MFLLILIPVIVYFIINAIVASKFQDIAFKKGYDFSIHSFAWCFWLGIMGCLYVIALPDLKNQQILSKNSQPETVEPIVFTGDMEKYNKLLAMAERYKDTFFDRNLRIRIYESIIKDLQIYADNNFEDSVVKIEEFRAYLDGLKKRIYK